MEWYPEHSSMEMDVKPQGTWVTVTWKIAVTHLPGFFSQLAMMNRQLVIVRAWYSWLVWIPNIPTSYTAIDNIYDLSFDTFPELLRDLPQHTGHLFTLNGKKEGLGEGQDIPLLQY